MARAEFEDSDALAELLVAAAGPVTLEALQLHLDGWSEARFVAARQALQSLGARLLEDRNGITLSLSDPLDAAAIRAALPSRSAFGEINVVRVCSSTNDRVRARGGVVACVAEAQTAGRGRRGHLWIQPFGGGLALSLGAPAPRGRLDPLAIAMAAAAANALRDAGYHGIGLKWPNDLYARGRKLGGVLIEIESGGPARVIVGLGLNVHAVPALAGRDAVALADLDGPRPRRNRLAAQLVVTLANALERFDAEGFAPFASAFTALDVLAGREVRLAEHGDELRGVAHGIDELGALIIETESGRLRRTAGEVTLGAWAGA